VTQFAEQNRRLPATALAMTFSLLGFLAGCTSVTPTVEFDPSLGFVELHDYRFHVRTFGD
jgi:hypothetical protein